MRRRPTPETMTFICPRCAHRQKGYFAICPTVGCSEGMWQEFIQRMRERMAHRKEARA